MIKIIGAIFILLSTSWAGFEVSKYLTERPRQLRLLKVALQSLEAEITYSHTPLHEAARKISKQLQKPVSWFFEGFSKKLTAQEISVKKAWEDSLDEVWKLTAFKTGEYEIMKQFGENLGKHDLVTQQKHIHLALKHLEREETEAVERQRKYEKMTKSLGFLSGLLLIILLL
ncbi:stage III sporulation protein SpoIIIAB [Rossellomorea oryzaecorticis]|jgi:stage III sporulation protein AB|uniref:Stage III sporulation protein SpoIIIAB n=1 Tax=Rossellomorea oryzaecorticis TaxID=1396505 RepID=A0ABW8VRE9_9BACI|nr:stage III sporulation protein SpoIIIAB [[Bacillus] enclensis]MBH9967403.1 stage III sporulation protein SpoAB [[Bacillus] enclensis]OAT84168.1 stage III sporulation protein SpoAB [Bacillus sp. MKU004]QTC43462.1 stage III sporulation protein SpoAB [Bacillus sp. V3]QWC21632.1 stage III sporulation protein SpoAB [Bacillus haikouensis]